jgi:hypothetical protein
LEGQYNKYGGNPPTNLTLPARDGFFQLGANVSVVDQKVRVLLYILWRVQAVRPEYGTASGMLAWCQGATAKAGQVPLLLPCSCH